MEKLLYELNQAIRRTEERLQHCGVESDDIDFSMEPLYEFTRMLNRAVKWMEPGQESRA